MADQGIRCLVGSARHLRTLNRSFFSGEGATAFWTYLLRR
jgi:hypothetical protein